MGGRGSGVALGSNTGRQILNMNSSNMGGGVGLKKKTVEDEDMD